MEYAAVIVLVAAIAASLFMVGLPRLISDGVGDAVGDALGPSEPGPGDSPGSSSEESGEVGSDAENEEADGDSSDEQSSENSDQSGADGESGGQGDPVEVDPAPYLPDEDGGTVSTAPWGEGNDFVVGEAWSPKEEWERIKKEPWITFEDNGNYDWYCGQVLWLICKAGGGIAEGANEVVEGLEADECLYYFCGQEKFEEGWSEVGEGLGNLWDDPIDFFGDALDSMQESTDQNYENNGNVGGLFKNFGYAAAQVAGSPTRMFGELRDSGSSSGQSENDRRRKDDCHNSFAPGTLVFLADGTAKPIEKVIAGDLVLAKDPETGKQGEREVTNIISSDGAKTLVDVMVDDGSGEPGTVTATDNHPFWVPDQGWTDAIDLEPGSWLQTSSGVWVQVGAVDVQAHLHQPVHNITVQDLHTYYVLAGDTPVLVHNSGECDWSPHHENAGDLAGKYSEGQSTRDPASQWYHEELSDDDLLDSINNAAEGDGIAVSPGGTVLGGHHRWDELQTRIDDGRIDPKTSIRIDVFGED